MSATIAIIPAKASPAKASPRASRAGGLIPGLAVTGAITAIAFAAHRAPWLAGLSPMILAIGLGIATGHVAGVQRAAGPGIAFASRRLLRLAIVLLGLRLTIAELAGLGGAGLAMIAAVLAATLLFTTWLARRLGVEPRLARLIAAGTAICGASAVVATNAVTGARDEDVTYAVACVTIFGTLAMLAYPLAGHALGLSPRAYGLWAGASIHEIAQVAGAAFQAGPQAGETAAIAKLARVLLLAPVVLAFGAMRGRSGGARPPLPWFVAGFLGLAALNSTGLVAPAVGAAAAAAAGILLTMALAAMGLATDLRRLRGQGARPLLLAAAASLFISALSLALIGLMPAG